MAPAGTSIVKLNCCEAEPAKFVLATPLANTLPFDGGGVVPPQLEANESDAAFA